MNALPDTGHLSFQVLEICVLGLGWIRHLKVWRIDGQDGITWDELQTVKDEALGPGVQAVEVYPPAYELVNDVNLRHLWEIPAHIPLPNLWRGNED